MTYTTLRRTLVVPILACVAMASGVYLQGYSTSGHKWGASRVNYYVNPTSKWVSASAAVAAVQEAASVWNTQSGTNIELLYAGTTGGGSLALNRKNEIFFRDSSSGAVAETWWWYDGTGYLVDFDMIYYEGAYRFFAGSGCSSGIYIENVGAHEFGHALGLNHSSVAGVTMQPKMTGYCDRTQLTLEADDISGIRKMYGTTSIPVNTAPVVAIASPSSGLSVSAGSQVQMSGSASDSEDGNISNRLVWTSSLLGQIGVGASVSFLATEGTHTITARAQDVGGLSASRQILVSVTPTTTPAPTTPTLTGRAYRENRMPKVDLSWTHPSAAVDVFRNGVKVKTQTGKTIWTDAAIPSPGTYTYKVCAAELCSNAVIVTV